MRYRDVLRSAVLASCTVLVATTAQTAQAQRLTTSELFERGKAAYDRLPASVTLADAREFSEALRYLYAYEQRSLREGGQIERPTQEAIDWLVESVSLMRTGKGDGGNSRSDDVLLARGLTMLDSAKTSDDAGRVWHVTAFISGSANLFAYLQCAPDPSAKAREGYAWLSNARGRLVVAGVSADDPREGPGTSSWRPRRPRPGARRPRPIVDVQAIPADAVVAAASASAGTAAKPPTGDSLQALRESNERLRLELAAALAANDSLRSANEELRRRLGSGERDVVVAARLIAEGRLREARELAGRWLVANPSDGDAHMVLSQVYELASRRDATPEGRVVTLLAIQHLTIAMKTGAVGFDVGRKMLAELETRTPTADDLASRGWVVGQQLRVSFAPYEWIDEVTTIRARRE